MGPGCSDRSIEHVRFRSGRPGVSGSRPSPKRGCPGEATLVGIRDALAVLGGADLAVLRRARSERATFVALGMVMLATAAVAAVSMVFAMRNAVLLEIDPDTGAALPEQPGSHLVVAIVLGVLWGILILVLDRALIKTMQGVTGWRLILYVLPRLALAFVIGAVVSTPITLQVFRDEIIAQVKLDQDAAVDQQQTSASNSAVAAKLADVQSQISAQEDILKGNVAGLTSAALESAQAELTDAQAAEAAAVADQQQKLTAELCELQGKDSNPNCAGLPITGKAGRGPEWEQRVVERQAADQVLAQAKQRVATAQTAVDAARQQTLNDNAGKVAEAQLQANIRLCGTLEGSSPPQPDPACTTGLRHDAEVLTTRLQALQDGTTARQRSGLLAQITALGEVSARNSSAATAHIFVLLLFMIIELLPVILKTFIAMRGESQYDRVYRKLQSEEYELVESQTEAAQKQREREIRKREAIRDDMNSREIEIGKEANEYVAGEMRTIVKRGTERWGQQINAAFAANVSGQHNGHPQSGSQAQPSGHPQSGGRAHPDGQPQSGQTTWLHSMPDSSQI